MLLGEIQDAFPKDLCIFTHHITLSREPILFLAWQSPVSLAVDKDTELDDLVVQFVSLGDDPFFVQLHGHDSFG